MSYSERNSRERVDLESSAVRGKVCCENIAEVVYTLGHDIVVLVVVDNLVHCKELTIMTAFECNFFLYSS
jgi:hypothetical protein